MEISKPKCKLDSTAIDFCLSTKCSTKYICSNFNCECNVNHLECMKISWSNLVNKVYTNKTKQSQAFKSVTTNTHLLFTNIKKYVEIAQSQFLNWQKQFGTDNQMKLLKLLRQQNFESITKEQIFEIYNEINSEYSCVLKNEKINDKIDQIRKGLQIFFDEIKMIYNNSIMVVKKEAESKNQKIEKKIENNISLNKNDKFVSKIFEVFEQNEIKVMNEKISKLQTKDTIENGQHRIKLVQMRNQFSEKIKKLETELMNHPSLKMFTDNIKQFLQIKLKSIFKKIQNKQTAIIHKGKQYLKTPLNKITKKQSDEMKELFTSIELFIKEAAQQFRLLIQQIKGNIQAIKISSVNDFFDKSISRMNLLYRASQEKFQISKFWEKCNKKTNTLVIIKTEFIKVIGGFTPMAWDLDKSRLFGNSFQSDPSLMTFVFSLTEKHQFRLKNKTSNAIGHYKNWGPTFGSDISICNNANISAQSYGDIGSSFIHEQYEYENQESRIRFTGQQIGHNYLIQQWEVYQIVFES